MPEAFDLEAAANECLSLIEAQQFQKAAQYLRKQPQEKQPEVAARMVEIIQQRTGGYKGWLERKQTGKPEPQIPDFSKFHYELDRLDQSSMHLSWVLRNCKFAAKG